MIHLVLYQISAIACLAGGGCKGVAAMACFGGWAAMTGFGIYVDLHRGLWWPATLKVGCFVAMIVLSLALRDRPHGEEAAG